MVAKRTGVSEHALRIWERRYGNLASHRSDAGYRLYTEDDVGRITLIRELLDAGHAIGEIATLPVEQLRSLRGRFVQQAPPAPALPGPVAEVARERFLGAIDRLDLDEAGRVASAAIVAFPPFELLTEVTAPLLREIGRRWQDGRFTVAQEHAASAILRGQLGELLRAARPSSNAPTLVTTTPQGELHEFGALIASIVAATAGARVIYLGPNMPAADLASAAKRSEADAAVLSVVAMNEDEAREQLAEIRRAMPRPIAVWAGGAGLRKNPPTGVTWLHTLEELRTFIEERRV